jgi:hypothetical protein
MEGFNTLPEHLSNWEHNEIDYNLDDNDAHEVLIFYDTEEGEKMPFLAKGDLLVITGKEKSRKTTLAQSIIASGYTADPSVTMNFYSPTKPLVYYFDTEQPIRRTKKNIIRFHEMCGLDEKDENYRVFNIKQYTHTQKLELIGHIIVERYEQTGKYPDIICIDQIGDLAPERDVNDAPGASNAYNHVDQWRKLTGAATIAIIHTNRGGKDANGKLGVVFDQKCDVELIIEKNEDGLSKVMNKLARDLPIPTFTFRQ